MSSVGPLDPDRLAAAEFSTSFRGYDIGEVRAVLVTAGDALRAAAARDHELREQLALAEAHLREVRETATAEAEQAAADGRQQGREMVAEAQRVRERMLGDLARRRRHARQQVEQLMAGRERLLEAFEVVRQTIDIATQEMRTSLPEARMAAEAAGRRSDDEAGDGDDGDEDAIAALEEEIEAARLAGLPIIEDGEPEAEVTQRHRERPLLGERDQREMPPVEPSADFEDVRIVPVAAEPGPVDEPDAHDEPEPEEEGGPDDHPEPEHEAVPVDESEPAPEMTDEPEDPAEDDFAPVTEPETEPEPEGASEDEPASDEGEPGHLDDLFASLRAARAEAVVDAKAVLATSSRSEDAEVESETERESGPEPEPEPADTAPAFERDEALASARDGLGRALKRVLADEQNDVLDRLRRLRKNQTPADPEVLGDTGELAERFAAVAVEPLVAVAATGMASVSHDGRARPPAPGPMAATLAGEIVESLHERLSRGLADAGTDTGEASERVRASFREWKTQRIAAAVADATRSAFHQGLLAGASKGAGLRWVLDSVDEACPECADNALAGPVTRGDAYPTGHKHPPAHAGCACVLELAEAPSP